MHGRKIDVPVVDDEERFLSSIRKALEAGQFNVIAVNRGDKAVDAAKKHTIDSGQG